MSEVSDRFQAWFPLQLRVHPGDIGCQLLLQPINHTGNPNNPQRTYHNNPQHISQSLGRGTNEAASMNPLFEMLDHGERGGASLLPHLLIHCSSTLHYRPIIIIIIIIIMCSIRRPWLCSPHVFIHFHTIQLYRSHLTT